jgi:archaellum component FlaF (FlaF/FlaG flagellin family)
MKTRNSALAISALALLFAVSATSAATVTPGELVKIASRPDVYCVGPDMKRYVFPNEKTYFTWYSGFNTNTVTDAELAALQIGGAVTYRPGYRMVKVTTDPKTYAVAEGGILRWIQSESVATALYGAGWASKVEDLPDEFFATYTVGAPIASASDFSPDSQLVAATSIAIDLGLATSTPPVTPTSTAAALDLATSKTAAAAGDFVTLTATGSDPTGVSSIDLFFDGSLVKTCTFSPCGAEVQIPLSGTKTTYEAKAVMTGLNQVQQTKTLMIPVVADETGTASLTILRPLVKTGDLAEAVVDAGVTIAVLRTDIYLNGNDVKGCAAGIRVCRWTDYLTGSVGTAYDVYGKVTDTLGRTHYTVHKTITVSAVSSPIVTVSPAKTLIFKGETVDVTVSAESDNGIAKIDILKDGLVIKTCMSAAPCTITTGPWTSVGTLSFSGSATDPLGVSATSSPTTVTVQ